MRIRTARVIVASVAVAVSSVAGFGCSSSSSSKAPAGPTLTQDQFVQQADAICLADTSTIVTAATQLGDSPSPQQQQQWITQTVVPLYNHTIKAIGVLTPPKDLAAKVGAWLTAFQKEVTNAASKPAAMLDGSGGMPTVYNRAKELGLQQCSQAPQKAAAGQ